jgi:hypothetical protein
MPRLISSLSRILKLVTLSWLCLIGLWTFLPSPTIHDHQQYIQQTLRSGHVLHTIHRWSPSFSANSASQEEPFLGPSGSFLTIDWRLVSATNSAAALLEMGHDFRVPINLTDAILNAQGGENAVYNPNTHYDAEGIPSAYIGEQVTVQVDDGGEDHMINMPWFHWPDAALFYNQMHGSRYTVHVRAVARRGTNTVEIWKAATLTKCARKQKDVESVLDMDFGQISPEERSIGLLASFSNIHPEAGETSGSIISTIAVADMPTDTELPSTTYQIRSLILVPLAPSLTVVLFLLEFLTPLLVPVLLPILGAYTLIVLICWTYHNYHSQRKATTRYDYETIPGSVEKTRFVDWCSRFWMTRHVYSLLFYCCCCCRCCLGGTRRGRRDYHYHRYWPGEKGEKDRNIVIWGPAGPVYDN